MELTPELHATFLDAGHILGSASVLAESDEPAGRRSVLFSGDLGNAGRPLLRAPIGYAANVTLARQIIDGVKQVRLFGAQIPVRASIHAIGGFSAHPDQAELLDRHRQTYAGRTFLVHGDEEVIPRFAALLRDTEMEKPMLNEVFEL